MSGKKDNKQLTDKQLEKASGGGNELDTNFTHQITAEELPYLAKGTEILISFSSTSQCIGSYRNYVYAVPGVKNSLHIEFRVTRATPDLQSWVGVKADVGAQFNLVNVYKKP